jgi:hypothetical protein
VLAGTRLVAAESSPAGQVRHTFLMGGSAKNLVKRSRLTPVALTLIVLAAAGCGSSSKSTTNVISAGQVDIQLPPGWKVTKNGAVRPSGSAASATGASAVPGAAGASGDTVPLAKEDPTTKFFKSLNVFQNCLSGLNVKFIGVPDGKDPGAPVNNPDYIKALSTCAAKSNIVQALKDQQTAQDALTPAEVETQNKNYLKWRDCMIGRGWGIPTPKPDAKGRLFSFGASGSSVPNFTPPPGQDILSSGDVTACATEVQNSIASGASG